MHLQYHEISFPCSMDINFYTLWNMECNLCVELCISELMFEFSLNTRNIICQNRTTYLHISTGFWLDDALFLFFKNFFLIFHQLRKKCPDYYI